MRESSASTTRISSPVRRTATASVGDWRNEPQWTMKHPFRWRTRHPFFVVHCWPLWSATSERLELFTEDVIGDSPNLYVRSRTELEYQLLDRAGALSNVEFDLDRVVMDGPDTAVASWRVTGDHTGEVLFNEDIFFPPTGRKIRLSVTTHVEFRQRQIAEFRTSYETATCSTRSGAARRQPDGVVTDPSGDGPSPTSHSPMSPSSRSWSTASLRVPASEFVIDGTAWVLTVLREM